MHRPAASVLSMGRLQSWLFKMAFSVKISAVHLQDEEISTNEWWSKEISKQRTKVQQQFEAEAILTLQMVSKISNTASLIPVLCADWPLLWSLISRGLLPPQALRARRQFVVCD
jgi:hypothetical protein